MSYTCPKQSMYPIFRYILGFRAIIVIMVQVLGKYLIIGYLDPQGVPNAQKEQLGAKPLAGVHGSLYVRTWERGPTPNPTF